MKFQVRKFVRTETSYVVESSDIDGAANTPPIKIDSLTKDITYEVFPINDPMPDGDELLRKGIS